ncbi:hypothetical protein Misp01_31780 [Microtetraspora sp. NBRC 13810]|nr:hypothetical protein Misp01_31780 [Microtetraspora sp. NBRC 13810]
MRVEKAALFVRDGRFVTSAGVTAGIDLSISLIEDDLGAEFARDVARELVVFMARPGDQSQFSVRLEAIQSAHGTVRVVMDEITADPAGNHTLTSLAQVAGVSVRHLSRVFAAETGQSPLHFLDKIRLEAAGNLLLSGNDTLATIAQRTGLGSAESLRRLFVRELGVSPGAYRDRFRTTRPGGLDADELIGSL